jgi:hypothetical protein
MTDRSRLLVCGGMTRRRHGGQRYGDYSPLFRSVGLRADVSFTSGKIAETKTTGWKACPTQPFPDLPNGLPSCDPLKMDPLVSIQFALLKRFEGNHRLEASATIYDSPPWWENGALFLVRDSESCRPSNI